MRLADLVIPNGATNGTPIDVRHIDQLTIYGPTVLTGVISIEMSPDGTNFFPVTGVPAINIRVDVPIVNASDVRLVSTMAEAAERKFPTFGSDLRTV